MPEEKNWLELFFDSEIPPEIPEKMKQKLVDQLYPELREMSPLDACMKMAAAQIGFSEDMTPDTLRNDQEKLAILRQIGKDYNTIIQTGDAERLKSEVSHKTKPMKFTGLISAMETAAQKPGEYPYIQKEGKKYFNENYNPLNDDKVKEKIIKAAPILKAFSYGSADENSGLGAMLAKETLETLDYSVRAYEALEKKDYDMTLRFSNIAVKHMVQSTILQGYSAFGDIGRYLRDNKGMYSMIHERSTFDGCGLRYSLKLDNIFKNQNGHRLLSPIGSSMLLIQNGLNGNVSKYSTLVDPKTSKGIELRYGFLDKALHLDYEELKKATRAEINKADIAALKLEKAQDMEKNKQNDASKNEPEIVLS